MQRLNLFSFLSALFVSTHAVRILVDDANSTWSYSGSWNAITSSTPCSACATQPDPSKAYNNSWHDTALDGMAQLGFTGVSIEVYTICPPRQSDGSYYGTNFSFTLDNVGDGIFRGPQPACNEFMYNYLAYARTNLTLGPHIFQIGNSPLPGVGYSTSDLLLDYAIYDDGTVPPPPSPSSCSSSSSHSSVSTATDAGLGVVAGLLLLANIVQFFWSRKTKLQAGSARQGTFHCYGVYFMLH
jgi:hypothetical protein